MQDTYTLLRHFADSWWLLSMMLFFIGCVIFALRPGSRRHHREMANLPLRDDDYEPVRRDGPASRHEER